MSTDTERAAEFPFILCLYVSGHAATSSRAIVNIRKFCEDHLKGRYDLQVVDLLQHPHLAAEEQIIAVPTLVRRKPAPVRRFIGDLSSSERLLARMDLDLVDP